MDKVRIELLVIDLVERMRLPQDISIRRIGRPIYTGSIRGIPKELLNEKVISINTNDYSYCIIIEIE